jgi:hypothetical protein
MSINSIQRLKDSTLDSVAVERAKAILRGETVIPKEAAPLAAVIVLATIPRYPDAEPQ